MEDGIFIKYIAEGKVCVMDLNKLAKETYWLDRKKGFPYDNFGEKIALIHDEVSETLRAHRKGHDDKIGKEMADIILRVLGLAHHMNIDIEGEILEKHEYNKTRPSMHGNNRY